MCRFLLSAALIFVLLTAALLPPATLAASRCSVKLPVTLLSLYLDSEFIYVGRYDKLEEGELLSDTDDYQEFSINKHFSISSALKGETRKMITVNDSEYRYKDDVAEKADEAAEEPEEAEAAEEVTGAPAKDEKSGNNDGDQPVVPEAVETEVAEEVAIEEAEDANEVRPGDSVLLFMKKDADSDKLVLSDYMDGMKKMTPDKLASYEVRIRELNEIFASKKPSYSSVVAWLVRCAEDPHTRWEGTYELFRSFQAMEYQAERAKTSVPDKASTTSDADDHGDEASTKQKQFQTGDPNFAKSLSEGEKLILTNVFLQRERLALAKDLEGGSSLGHGDRELIELVKRWGDAKVAVIMLEDLRAVSADTDLTSELMPTIASILGDNDLLSISASYTSIRWEDETAEVESEETEAVKEGPPTQGESPADAGAEVLLVRSEAGTVGASASEDEKHKNTAPKVKKKTYGELRKELFAKFLFRAVKLTKVKGDDKGQS